MNKEKNTIAEYMLEALDAVREVLESYRDSLPEKKHNTAMLYVKESLRALAGEKKSSKKTAYQAALFVRKAYAVRCKQTAERALSGDRDAALLLMREMGDESLALRALGYAIDNQNPSFLQAKMKLPPLVKFENATHPKDNDPHGMNDNFNAIKEEAKKRGII